MPRYMEEYPELTDWEDNYEMERHFAHQCFPYPLNCQPSFIPMPFMMETVEGPIFVRYARYGTRPVINCYPNLCYPIYITHK